MKPSTHPLQKEGLKVTDVVVLINREQGGAARMASNGLQLYSAFTLSFILEVLVKHSLVSSQVAASVKSFIAANQTFKQGDAATKASADVPAGTPAASGPEAAAAAKAAADAACAAPMPASCNVYKRWAVALMRLQSCLCIRSDHSVLCKLLMDFLLCIADSQLQDTATDEHSLSMLDSNA